MSHHVGFSLVMLSAQPPPHGQKPRLRYMPGPAALPGATASLITGRALRVWLRSVFCDASIRLLRPA
eukprot:11569325-Heterocapsa_arctica.AAC.1